MGGSDVVVARFQEAGLLVDGEGGDPRAGTPGGDLRDIVDELFEAGSAAGVGGVVFAVEDDGDVRGQASEGLDVPGYQLRRTVVVVEDGEDAVENGVVDLPEPDVEGEGGVDDGVDEQVELVAEEVPDGL